VLQVDLAGPPDGATAAELMSLATALAHDLRAADIATDRYQQARRQARLTLAAEMQWRMLPGRSCSGPEFSLAGQLEPAYSVRGDNFDWATEPEHLLVTVTDGHGEGVEASMLTLLGVTALRNARMATPRLSDQAALADQAVYAQHGGHRHLSTLLLRFDIATGVVTAVDAGSPLLLRLRGEELGRVELEAQLPLGMFESTVYVEQTFQVEPGDRLIVLSDGVHESRYGDGRYSELGRLRQTVLGTRRLPPAEAVRAVLADHSVFRQGAPLEDDAAVVCLDWSGRGVTPPD
jgi:serine phosphatase RsbU (regulator of sigma subunit)